MHANILLIIIGALMVLSFSVGRNGEAATCDDIRSFIDSGASETLLDGEAC